MILETTIKPVSVNQRYTISRGHLILSKTYRDTKQALHYKFLGQCQKEKWVKTKRPVYLIIYNPFRNFDIDATIKILLDAMEGVVYENDKQVRELSVCFIVGTKMQIEVLEL